MYPRRMCLVATSKLLSLLDVKPQTTGGKMVVVHWMARGQLDQHFFSTLFQLLNKPKLLFVPASKYSPRWRNQPESFQKGRSCKGKPSALTATTLRHFIKEWLRVLYRWINTPGMSPGAGSACGCRGKLWVIMTWSRMTSFPWDFLSACTAENATYPPPTQHTLTHIVQRPQGSSSPNFSEMDGN